MLIHPLVEGTAHALRRADQVGVYSRFCWFSEPDRPPIAIGKPLRVSAASELLAPLLLAQLEESAR